MYFIPCTGGHAYGIRMLPTQGKDACERAGLADAPPPFELPPPTSGAQQPLIWWSSFRQKEIQHRAPNEPCGRTVCVYAFTLSYSK
eukprot:COSAG05_NODE_332_length_11268_cov_132.023726_5_plen_86_part_00